MDKKLKKFDNPGTSVGSIDSLEIVRECRDTAEALTQTANRLMERWRQGDEASNQADTASDYIFVRDEKEYEKITLADIRYISGDAEYLSIHVAGREKPLREKSSFVAILRLLSDSFVQIHRSSIINMTHVSRVGKSYVVMDDGTRIRVSDSNRDRFYTRIAALTVGKNS